MCDVSDLFYKVNEKIEGYLSKEAEKDCKILFVLREPHATEKDTTEFWFQKVVNCKETNGMRYVNVLGKLAAMLLNNPKKEQSEDEVKYYRRLLRQCSFINLYPFCGDKTKSKDFAETLNALSNVDFKDARRLTSGDKGNHIKIAANRFGIICGLKPQYIVTVCDIFDALKSRFQANDQNGICIKIGNNQTKQFNVFDLNDETKVVAFYHPSYTRIKYESLDNATLGWNEKQS